METTYLCRFTPEGKRGTTYLTAGIADEEKQQKIADGYIEIDEEDWNYYVGNNGLGDNGTGYIRGADGKPTSAPPYIPTKEEKAARLYAELQSDLAEINRAIYEAVADDDSKLAADLRQEKKDRLAKYQADLARLEE